MSNKYQANSLSIGDKVLIDNNPCEIIEKKFTNPGKGQAFTKIKTRNLLTGRILESTLKAEDTIEKADVTERSMLYSYEDKNDLFFLDEKTYEQYQINKELVKDIYIWLFTNQSYNLTILDNNIIKVLLPNTIEIEIKETSPGAKGDTAIGATKEATLINEAIIKVPLFINTGDIVKINTDGFNYVSRVKS